ncbi:LOW QUALITY PROTEIN: coiled-coil domain-containing protein 57 [Aulostomus maculatus]
MSPWPRESVNCRCSATEVPLPATEVPPPATEVPLPATEVPPPATDVPLPATEVPLPATEVPLPATEMPPLATAVTLSATVVLPSFSMQSDVDSGLGDLEAQVASKEKEWKDLQAAQIHHLERSLKKAKEESSTLSGGIPHTQVWRNTVFTGEFKPAVLTVPNLHAAAEAGTNAAVGSVAQEYAKTSDSRGDLPVEAHYKSCYSTSHHSNQRKRYQKLREDFLFNLAILDERDRELERYDVITTRAVALENNRQEELSHLCMQVAMLEEKRAKEAEERQEELSTSQHNAAQHRLELDYLKHDPSRQEMTAAFDSRLRHQKHEFNLKLDELRAVLLSNDVKIKLLSKENEVHCQARFQATEDLKASKEQCQQLQSQLQHKDQAIQDISAAKDHRIKELEDKVKLVETNLEKEEADHLRKYEDVVQALKECKRQLEAQRQAHTEQLQRAEKHMDKLQDDMDDLSAQARSAQQDQQEVMKRKDEIILRLRTDVQTVQTGWNEYISQVSSEKVAKDTEMITLQEREAKLKTELERSRGETERYKQELSAGLKRERALEQLRAQVELEWQRRCEDTKAEHYLANEQLIQDLTQARDQVKAELHERDQELQDLTVHLHSVKRERDEAMQGLPPKGNYLASEEIRSLQEQNSILRSVVSQMRKAMEDLTYPRAQTKPLESSSQTVQCPAAPVAQVSINPTADTQRGPEPPSQTLGISSKITPAAPDYTWALEEEVCKLKAQCRNLEGQLEGATGRPSWTPAIIRPPVCQGNLHPHNQGLNQGSVCLEKCANSTALKKQEVRVAHIESALANIMEQFQEENLRWQQLASGVMSGAPFGKVQAAKSSLPLMHTRLKQAASYIARLNREKQQLIEMGNRLRAQIGTAGRQGTLPDPLILHKSPVEPERDSSTEKQRDQHGRLSALEHLQYQLTTQELQYAVKQRAVTVVKQPPETDNPGPPTRGEANPCSPGNKCTDRPEVSKTTENTCGQPPSSLEVKLQPQPGLSRSHWHSEESLLHLQELWDILDHGLSLSTFSGVWFKSMQIRGAEMYKNQLVLEGESDGSRREVAEPGDAGVTVRGISALIHTHPSAVVQQTRKPSKTPSNTSKTCRPGVHGRASRIRNYNLKD